MRRVWQLCGSVLIAFGLILPLGDLTAPLLLILAVDVAVATLVWRAFAEAWRRRRSVLAEDARFVLLRRTVPHLRQRRPPGVIEMQIRWRIRAETAAARRRGAL